ncbi:permease-like cell division protein FtsX [uncultured Clostridium sp.]|uniref:permease-like cell division protein FtsX n=1 Tax=uncultured Clostridium sp. TaxID=59620 RepID=UPI0032170005
MKFDSLKYSFMEALKSIKRNKTLSIASIATVTATLFILGAITLGVANVDKAITKLGSMVEVTIYLKDNISDNNKNAIENKIKTVEDINTITFKSKEEALKDLREQLNDKSGELTSGFEDKNPFPASFTVNVKEPLVVDKVVSSIKDMEGIEEIKDARSLIAKISKLTDSVKIVAAVAFVVFIMISLFLIGNTIKITVFTRKKEIGIMKYVGATDWFIRWPFIIEGIILGIVGACISVVILSLIYAMMVSKFSADTLFGFSLVGISYIWKVIVWEFLGCGIFIGAIGSIISMRKFLKV